MLLAGTKEAVKELVDQLNHGKLEDEKVEIVVAPTFIHLQPVVDSLHTRYEVAAQNCWTGKPGAFTGEVSCVQIMCDFSASCCWGSALYLTLLLFGHFGIMTCPFLGGQCCSSPRYTPLDRHLQSTPATFETQMAKNTDMRYPAAQIAAEQLVDLGVKWVILGHSERRALLKEDNDFVGEKAAYALGHGLKVIACIGETLDQRESGKVCAIIRQASCRCICCCTRALLLSELERFLSSLSYTGHRGMMQKLPHDSQLEAAISQLLVAFGPACATCVWVIGGPPCPAEEARMTF